MRKINKKNIKILLIRLSSMGDVILSSPTARLIKKRFPDAQLDFVVSSSFIEVFRHNPHIDCVIEYNKTLSALRQRSVFAEYMKSCGLSKYDIIIDLQNNMRSWALTYGRGKIYLRIKKRRLHKLSLVYFKKALEKPARAIPDIYLSTLSRLGINDDGSGLELWQSSESQLSDYPPASKNKIGLLTQDQEADRVAFRENNNAKSLNGSVIAMAPGAYHFTKRWKPERFAELVDMLAEKYNCEIILLGGAKDKEICGFIKERVKSRIFDYSGSTSILETAGTLDKCSMLITNDTGVMHIAAARRIPVVAIFGSTVTDFGFAPYRTKSIIVEADVPCRPCTHIGRSECPKGHFDCMNKISAEMVFRAVESLAD